MIFTLNGEVVAKIIWSWYKEETKRVYEDEQAAFALLEDYGFCRSLSHVSTRSC